MTLFNPIDPLHQVVTRVQKPTKPVRRYTAAETKALEDHYIACIGLITGKKPKRQAKNQKITSSGKGDLSDQILALIHGNWMTAKEVSEAIGVSMRSVTSALHHLKRNGYTKTKGERRNVEHFGFKSKTRRTATAENMAKRRNSVMSKVTQPMTFNDIADATGLPRQTLHNTLAAMVKRGKLVRVNASEMGMCPSVQYLYAPAEGGEV